MKRDQQHRDQPSWVAEASDAMSKDEIPKRLTSRQLEMFWACRMAPRTEAEAIMACTAYSGLAASIYVGCMQRIVDSGHVCVEGRRKCDVTGLDADVFGHTTRKIDDRGNVTTE